MDPVVSSPFSKISLPPLPIFEDDDSSSLLSLEFVGEGEFGKSIPAAPPTSSVVRFAYRSGPQNPVKKLVQELNAGFCIHNPAVLNGGAYDLNAKIFEAFCVAIEKVASKEKLFIPQIELNRTLSALAKGGFISEDKKALFWKMIPSKLLREDYERAVMEDHDCPREISLACKFIEEGRWMSAIASMAKAKMFYQEEQRRLEVTQGSCEGVDALLGNLMDLPAFFSRITKISGEGVGLFAEGMQELICIAARSSSLKKINLWLTPCTLRGAGWGLGLFLAQSKSVEEVILRVPVAESNAREDFSSVIEGLKCNSSVRIFRVFDYSIGDAGVAGIIDAIQKNSDSKMQLLELSVPDMTGESAKQLLELMRRKPLLKVVLVDCLNVPLALRSAIELMASLR